MSTKSRIAPVELSRKQIDNQTVQAQYKAGYGFFVVRSKFIGKKSPNDLFYEIIQMKRENSCHEQHDS